MQIVYRKLSELKIDWSQLQLIKRRQRDETLREVYIEGEQYVFKRFIINKNALFFPRPWIAEGAALLRAQGLNAPEYIAIFAGIGSSGQREFVLQRTFVPGPHLVGLPDARSLDAIADLLAAFHQRGIVTRDATPRNFLIGAGGAVSMIDLGKAQIHRHHPFYGIGSELARFVHATLVYDADLSQRFLRRYYEARPTGAAARYLEQFFYQFCKASRIRRRGLRP